MKAASQHSQCEW